MRCYFCKGNVADGYTSYVTDLETCAVIIRNVPCHKCTQCGEVSFTLEVAERIEQIIDNLRDSVTEVAIIKYTEKVA